MSGNSTKKKRIREILSKLDREMITTDTVKQTWLDKHGCRFLPHVLVIKREMNKHPRWISNGEARGTVYRRRL